MRQGQDSVAQLDFSAGMVRDAAPHQIDERAVWDHINGFYEEDGSAFKRGGTVNHSDAAFGTSLRWIWDGYFDAGQRTVFANPDNFAVLDSDDESPVNLGSDGLSSPVGCALLKGMLFIGGGSGTGHIYAGSRKTASYSTTSGNTHVTNGSTTVTDADGGFDSNLDAGMLLQVNTDERVYVVESVDSDTQVTLTEVYEGSDSTTENVTFYGIYKITSTDPYRDAAFYAVVANRLLYGDGNEVHCSEVNAPHDWTAAIVGGDPESVPTVHGVPEGVEVTGIAPIRQTAMVFTTGGLWTLDGLQFNIVDAAGTPQHRLNLLSRELILWGVAGISSWQQMLVVPCIDGIYLLDGISGPQPVSPPVDELYREYVRQGYQPGGAEVSRAHYFLPVLNATASRVLSLPACRLDRVWGPDDRHPWSRLSGAGGDLAALAARYTSSGAEPLLLGAEIGSTARVVDCSGLLAPDDTNTTDADGSLIAWTLVTRDYPTGNLTENVVAHVKSRYELAGDGATIDFDYGFGAVEQAGFAWNEWEWADAAPDDDELEWEGDDSDVFYALDCPGDEDDGLDTHRCRVGKRARYMRIRVRNESECSRLRLRSLELMIRPSRARRR